LFQAILGLGITIDPDFIGSLCTNEIWILSFILTFHQIRLSSLPAGFRCPHSFPSGISDRAVVVLAGKQLIFC
jgi:hypothetical protein